MIVRELMKGLLARVEPNGVLANEYLCPRPAETVLKVRSKHFENLKQVNVPTFQPERKPRKPEQSKNLHAIMYICKPLVCIYNVGIVGLRWDGNLEIFA